MKEVSRGHSINLGAGCTTHIICALTTRPDALHSPDVIVIGGGPAGSAAATLLSQCGHAVVMIDRSGPARHVLAESLPPSAKKTLSALGLLNVVDAAGFHPWLGNTVWWGDATPRIETFGPGVSGYQLERGRFDALLRDAAVTAGAHLVLGLVREVSDDRRVTVEMSGGEVRTLTAPFILDCSGRAGVIARNGWRVAPPSHHTVALGGVWRATTCPIAERTHTLIASYADGWAWSVPTSDIERYVTVMVDPERTQLARGAAAVDVYRAELAKVAAFAPLLASASLSGGPWGADASPYSATRYADAGVLLVGDAGSSLDPLSSFGVKKALASAWLAGVAVNTAMRTPSMAAAAFAFFDEREREVHAAFTRQTAALARDAAALTAHPFWQMRAASAEGIDFDEGTDPALLARDPDVLAALSDIQRRPRLQLRVGDAARVVARPAVRGREIVMDDHLFLPAWPRGVRYLRNIDVIHLSRLASEHRDAGELYAALTSEQPGISLPDFLGALATLVARGGLTW